MGTVSQEPATPTREPWARPSRMAWLLVGAVLVALLLWAIHFDRIGEGRRYRHWLAFFATVFSLVASYAALWLVVFTGVREGVFAARKRRD